ncbi:MAG TPA: hypothetical protein DER26_06395 [Verrucomicrobia bacterium]|nr:hypothetical protein [Verrucomicrobiota bacterium]
MTGTTKEELMKALRFILSWAALAAVLPGLAFAAEYPDAVGGVLTLDVGTGESETYDKPLPSGVNKLVKTGAGEAVLTVATTAFAGAVDIQAGTLTLKDAAAVGSGTKVEVTGDAATLHLNFARPSGADDVFFAEHDVTIRGWGVDKKGAFRYTDPENANNAQDDRLLESLTLSGDAAIAVPTRFGIGRALNLNSNVLVRVDGTGNWMWNSEELKVDAGVISNLVGNIVWQKDPEFSDPGRTRLCMDGGTLTAWYAKKLPCAVVFNGGALNGNGETENNLAGPVTILKNMVVSQGGVGQCTRFSGTVRCDVSQDGRVELNGQGIHYFDGPFGTTGSFFLNGGVTSVGADFCVSNLFRLSKTGASVFRQTAGRLEVTSAGNWIAYIGEDDGAYGRYVMTGGTAAFAGAPVVGANAGACGLFWQAGGVAESTNGVNIGRGGRALLGVVAGAKFKAMDTNAHALPLTKLASQSGGSGVLAVSGEGSAYEAGSLALGVEDGSPSTNAVVVTDGGVLKAGRLYSLAQTSVEGVAADVYFDGGILMPTRRGEFRDGKASPRHWEIGPKGMVIDSAEGAVAQEMELIWSHPLSDLSGRGIASVTLPTNGAAYAAEAYFGPVFVDIEGPSGSYGAVAVAECCDPATRKLTGVSVLAPGSGYDERTKVYVHSADGKSRYECTYELTDADRAGGRLVKRGKPALGLDGVNTYTGGTTVEEGALKIRGTRSFPENTPLTVRPGATFDAGEKELKVSVLSGLGGAINCASLTVTKELEITVVDLFAEDSRALKVNAALVFGEGVAVRIVDPENLDKYRKAGDREVVCAAGGITGAPPALDGELAKKWNLKMAGGTLKFGFRRGFCLIMR